MLNKHQLEHFTGEQVHWKQGSVMIGYKCSIPETLTSCPPGQRRKDPLNCYQRKVQKPASVMVWGVVSANVMGNVHICEGNNILYTVMFKM